MPKSPLLKSEITNQEDFHFFLSLSQIKLLGKCNEDKIDVDDVFTFEPQTSLVQ